MLDLVPSTSWFAGEFDASWIGQQYNALLAAKDPKFLNDPTIKGKDPASMEAKKAFVLKWGRHWKNTLIGNSNARTFDRTHLNVTLTGIWWHQSISRAPRSRFGNIHLYNNFIEGIDNGVMTGFEACLLVQNCYFLNGKKLLYGDEGAGRALNCLYHGPSGPKKNDAPYIEVDTQEICGTTTPESIKWPEERNGRWHAVGDWWKDPEKGNMEDSLPYSYVLVPTLDVPAFVIKNAGAGKISLPSVAAARSTKEIWALNCSSCHGLNGDARTVVGARWEMLDYTDPAHQKKFDDAKALAVIREGVARDALYRMAPFKDRLSDKEAENLVLYVRNLEKR